MHDHTIRCTSMVHQDGMISLIGWLHVPSTHKQNLLEQCPDCKETTSSLPISLIVDLQQIISKHTISKSQSYHVCLLSAIFFHLIPWPLLLSYYMLIFNNQQQPAESITISAEQKPGHVKCALESWSSLNLKFRRSKTLELIHWFGVFTQGPGNGTRITPVLEDSPPLIIILRVFRDSF